MVTSASKIEYNLETDVHYSQHAVATSRSFAKMLLNFSVKGEKAGKEFPQPTLFQMKLLFAILEGINWREKEKDNLNIIILKNEELAKKLHWSKGSFEKNSGRFSSYVKKELLGLVETLRVVVDGENLKRIDIKDKKQAVDPFLSDIYTSTKETVVKVNPKFMPHIKGLIKEKPFIIYFVDDIYNAKSTYGIFLYIAMKYYERYSDDICEMKLKTSTLKGSVFGLSEESYTQKVDDGRKFKRTLFEKYTILQGIPDIQESQYLELLPQIINGKEVLFRKTYAEKGLVDNYLFYFRVNKDLMNSKNVGLFFQNFNEDMTKDGDIYKFPARAVSVKEVLTGPFKEVPTNEEFAKIPREKYQKKTRRSSPYKLSRTLSSDGEIPDSWYKNEKETPVVFIDDEECLDAQNEKHVLESDWQDDWQCMMLDFKNTWEDYDEN